MPVSMVTSYLWYPSWTDVLVEPVAVGQGINDLKLKKG